MISLLANGVFRSVCSFAPHSATHCHGLTLWVGVSEVNAESKATIPVDIRAWRHAVVLFVEALPKKLACRPEGKALRKDPSNC